MSDENRWICIKEASQIVGVHRRTLYNWMAAGKVIVRQTAGGNPRILESSLWQRREAGGTTDD